MSTDPTIQIGDIVVLKSGSPNMVVVKLPKDEKGVATVEYWGVLTQNKQRVEVPMTAIEKPEVHLERIKRLEEFQARLGGPIIRMKDTMVIIDFDTMEDKMRFIEEKFHDGESFKAKMH